MSLTEDDLDRIGDKLKIAAGAVMEQHMEKVHEPIYGRLTKIETRLAWYGGGLALLALLLGLGASVFGGGK